MRSWTKLVQKYSYQNCYNPYCSSITLTTMYTVFLLILGDLFPISFVELTASLVDSVIDSVCLRGGLMVLSTVW